MLKRVLKAGGLCKTVVGVLASVLTLTVTGCPADEPAEVEDRPVIVEVEAVEAETFHRRVRGIGSLRAKQAVQIAAEAEGRVTDIVFREGQAVDAGELLIKINDTKLQSRLASTQAALKGARSELDFAERTYERFDRLRKENVVAVEDYDRKRADFLFAQAEVARLEAEVELIGKQIADTRITAPFAGFLSTRMVDIGDMIAPGHPLVKLFSRQLEIIFTVPERYISQVEYGQHVEIKVDAFPARIFEAKVTFISPEIDQSTRTFTVKAQLNNENGLLKPGGFATAALTVEVLENEPVVPEEALIATRVGYILFVVENEVASQREVTIGLRRPGKAQVIDGVALDELVVVSGHMELDDGDRVQIIENLDENTSSKNNSS